MDSSEFRDFGKAMVDYIADYWDTIRDRDVLPSVQPNYLEKLIPGETPTKGEHWRDVLRDVDRVIMPGVTHWQSPNFHAYFSAGCSFPGVVGEMLSAGIGCIGLNWLASPACTELEVVTMDWLGKLLGLPSEFLNCSKRTGGGVIQGSASESTLLTLLAAKEKMIASVKQTCPTLSDAEIKGKLVAYTSDQANSSVERAGMLASVPMRLLPNENGQLRGNTLKEAMRRDKEAGLIPCYVVANLGTSGTCACDNLEELGSVCQEGDVWLHVDAAYAGSALSCPEYRHLTKGIEMCESFNFNPHKWLLVQFDCSALWVKNSKYLVETFNVDRIYLKHRHEDAGMDYRHWQIPLGRRFRALKLWFVLRIYGVEGIQKHIRTHVALAEYFEKLVRNDSRFEVCTATMGLVTFRLKGRNKLTRKLLDRITDNKKVYMIPCTVGVKLVIRFAVCSRLSETRDIDCSWSEIISHANRIVPLVNDNDKNMSSSVIQEKYDSLKISELQNVIENVKENVCIP